MKRSQNAPSPQVKMVLMAVFLAYLAQMTLNPIIAPLSRKVGLEEWHIGVTISAAAVMVTLTSQRWGRWSQSLGPKRVLLIALTLGVATTAGFAAVSYLGVAGLVTGTALFALFVALRGVGFGTAIAAVQPTAQAYIADTTTDEAARIKGMSSIGAVQGIAQIAGAIFGSLLAVFGLLTPVIAVPVLLGGGLVLVMLRLRPTQRTVLIENPVRVSPADNRVWPFLIAGFGMFTSLGFIQIISGFIVQDRLHLEEQTAAVLTGVALLAAGIGMIIAQTIIVPKSGWGPATLLRYGGAVTTLGFLALTPDLGPVGIFGSVTVIGLGLGTAMPGYTAGPTLLVSREEQGGLAGLIAATMGLTFVIAPTLSTVLYGMWAPLPVIVSAGIMALVTLFVIIHPRFRHLPMKSTENKAADDSYNLSEEITTV